MLLIGDKVFDLNAWLEDRAESEGDMIIRVKKKRYIQQILNRDASLDRQRVENFFPKLRSSV